MKHEAAIMVEGGCPTRLLPIKADKILESVQAIQSFWGLFSDKPFNIR